ncbi:hypothetical protein SAMN02745244_02279 [Tessaracoccus bendigoensis DSM 12906]|uniref:Uncharacterized protein n=1 Tax=Tessaracoccus bendigoensis DSM 12906 TaxID=1123357 RepID=A0A1M6IHF4_9ACTN|nr:hypothetical protein [Tessaracoccus bendigoensis]SHJ33869.1 hypothetical protein SAMN02745244_02279 [Tessaracoccus bendigoensis DSM 12906]
MKLVRVLGVSIALLAAWLTPTSVAQAAPDVYATPGVHLVSGRYWKTQCANYSPTVIRCTTEIYATKVFQSGGRWYKQNDFVFNNLSYLPSPRSQWASNPIGRTGSWTAADGRKWRTECDTALTGYNACRNFIVATVASEKGGVVTQTTGEVFNSMVRFSSSTIPPVTRIPAAAPARNDVPAPGPRIALTVAKPSTPAPSNPGGVAGSGKNCPAGYPVKGNISASGERIYHVPGGAFYDRTVPERCFASASDASKAGFRASLR